MPTSESTTEIMAENATISAEVEKKKMPISPQIEPCREFNAGGMPAMNEFASPGYPDRYRPGLDCVRVIYAPPNYDVIIHFNERFQIETSYELTLPSAFSRHDVSRCPNDFLEVRDGRYGFSPLIGRFCGMTLPEFEVRATSGYVYLRFHSDYLLEYVGFHAEYEFVRSDLALKQEPDCHIAHSYALDGYVDLHSMTHIYDTYRNGSKHFDCVWRIEVPTTMSIALFIEDFQLATPNSCNENFVEIYAGATAQQPLRKFCGVTATHTFTNENIVYVRVFAAGPDQVHKSKVKALFSTYSKSKNCSTENMFECGDDSCIPFSLRCNGRPNCLYGSDEKHCSATSDAIQNIVMSSYSPLLLVILFIFFIIVLMCLWARPCKYRIRRQPQKYESYLKQLSMSHSTALHYGMFSTLPLAYPKRGDDTSEHADENFSSKMTDLGKTISEDSEFEYIDTQIEVSLAGSKKGTPV
ncbi:hypothetical protein L596_010353 [Steinernema carpocapsae]|uniref:CUB domain-containing protein n=1 Tax=Steinernema carpocapsae TaxID=34508 RepID=A0A4V6A6X0_STECR|nr:hypothetical protein L596_010353 [Steinernema carpocapsae]